MAGHDPKDSHLAPIVPVPDFAAACARGVKGLRIGVPREYRIDGMPPEIEALWQQGLAWLREAGAEIVDVSLPHTKYGLADLLHRRPGRGVVEPGPLRRRALRRCAPTGRT